MDIKEKSSPRHLGRKVSRIRELLGVKQESLAEKLGISQQAVSKLEQSEQIEDATLEKIAGALGVRSEAIRNFSEEAALNIIANTFNSRENSVSIGYQSTFNFNPIDKWIDAIEEIRRLYEELLKSEREKVRMLERLMEDQKKNL
jgi:transcriptional regulator with XRE-family HTH domain